MSNSSISSRIQQIRESIGDRQIDFAQRIGASIGTVSNWENGATKPTKTTLRRVAEKCGVDEDWLLTGVGEMWVSKKHHHEPQTKRNHRPITPSHAVGEKTTGILSEGTTPVAGDVTNVLSGQQRVINPNPDEEVEMPPSWAMPVIMAAASIVFEKFDVERARRADREGKPFRLRLLYEEEPPDEKQEPPPQKP